MRSFAAELIQHMVDANVDTIHKPWGVEMMFTTPEFIAKLITINHDERTSLQYHRVKDEVIHILDGDGGVEVYDTIETTADTHYPLSSYVYARRGERVYIPRRTVHRSVGPVTLFEITSHPNSDIVRLSDDYDRAIRSERA